MSDVAFLLIIFFLVTSVFLVKEGLVITLPDPARPAMQVSPDQLIEIELKADGAILFNGKKCPVPEITSLMKEKREASPKSALLLKISGSLPYEKAVAVIDAIKRAGESRFSIRTF